MSDEDQKVVQVEETAVDEKLVETADDQQLVETAVNEQLVETAVNEQLVETAVNEQLVETAVKKISDIISSQIENAMMEVGKYILTEFFDDNIELAKKKKPVKDKSLLKVFSTIKEYHNSFSKSWFYNAINIVVDSKQLSSEYAPYSREQSEFHTYGNLSLSCKVLLTHVKDIKTKIKILRKIETKKTVTVKEFKKLIEQNKPRPDYEVLRILNSPNKLLGKNVEMVLPDKKLKKLPLHKVVDTQEKVNKKINSLWEQIEQNKKLIETYKNIENRLKNRTEEIRSEILIEGSKNNS